MKRSLLVSVLIAISVTPAFGGSLGIYTDAGGTFPCVGASGIVDAYVVYTGSPALEGIRFAAPVPTPGCVLVSVAVDLAVFPGTIGNSASEVAVDFGGCLSAPVHVLTIRLFNVSGLSSECCAWWPQSVEGFACGGGLVAVSPLPGYFTTQPCEFVAPHSPVPADGATGVPLSGVLDWQSSGGMECDLGNVLIHNLYFGTEPDALTLYADFGPGGPLNSLGVAPGTQYYWRAEATTYNGAGPYPGPLWTFTTAGPVAAQASTWGRIKSLYR